MLPEKVYDFRLFSMKMQTDPDASPDDINEVLSLGRVVQASLLMEFVIYM